MENINDFGRDHDMGDGAPEQSFPSSDGIEVGDVEVEEISLEGGVDNDEGDSDRKTVE